MQARRSPLWNHPWGKSRLNGKKNDANGDMKGTPMSCEDQEHLSLIGIMYPCPSLDFLPLSTTQTSLER